MWIRYLLGALLAFGAINAFAGGYYGLSGAAGVPLEWLAGSAFTNYFIPSLILFVVVGGAFSFAAVAVFARFRLARVAALAAGTVGTRLDRGAARNHRACVMDAASDANRRNRCLDLGVAHAAVDRTGYRLS